jgi:hypothetical protein
MRLDESSGGLHIAVSAKRKKTGLRLKRGVFSSIVELQTAINRFIAEANQNPSRSSGPNPQNAILAAVQRGRQALEAIH